MEQLTDLASVLRIVRRRAVYFLLPASLIAVAGTTTVMLLPPIFRSQATILVESQQIPTDLVQSTVSAMADERLQIIQQRTMSRDNILGLAKKFSLFSNQKDMSPTEMADLIRARIEIRPLAAANAGRPVRDDRLVLAFTIAYEDENPQVAASVANELVTTILSADAKTRVAQAADTTLFLSDEAKRLNEMLTQVESEISKVRLESADALPEKLAFNMSVNERLEQNITEVDRELQGIEEQKRLLAFDATVKSATADGQLRPAAQKDLLARIDTLKADIAAKKVIYSDTHPEMKALRKTLAAFEEELKLSATTVATGDDSQKSPNSSGDLEEMLVKEKMAALDGRIEFLKKLRLQYVASTDSLRSIISRTPDVAAMLTTLDRKRGGLQKDLDDVSNKLGKARLGERLEEDQRSERFEVIEQPIVPSDPSRPDRKKYLAAVLIAALGAGGGLAGITEFLDRRIRTAGQLLATVGVRPIAVIEFIALRGETRRRKWVVFAVLAAFAILIVAALFAIDQYYLPLELLLQKLIHRLGV